MERHLAVTLIVSTLGCTSPEPSSLDASVDAAGVDAAGVDAAGFDAAGVDAAGVDAAGVDAAGVDGHAAFALTSAAVAQGGALPVDYTCDGAGRSPPLAWSDPPAGTVGFAVMMTTLARDGLKWNWVLYDIPGDARALRDASVGVGTAGLTSDGPALAYSPPCSRGPGLMRYTFTVYALSTAPALPTPANRVTGAVLTSAVADITLASAHLDVTYTR